MARPVGIGIQDFSRIRENNSLASADNPEKFGSSINALGNLINGKLLLELSLNLSPRFSFETNIFGVFLCFLFLFIRSRREQSD